jgi:DNA polymerase III subunit chi
MTRVDFYILEHPTEDACPQFVCRLAEKAWRQGHTIHIHTGNMAMARHLDELLWTFREQSFIPHSLSSAPQAGDSPIHIGHAEQDVRYHDVLINLDSDVPLFFSRFQRVAEVIGKDEEQRRQGRQRFTFYRDRGYPLHTHTLSPGTS